MRKRAEHNVMLNHLPARGTWSASCWCGWKSETVTTRDEADLLKWAHLNPQVATALPQASWDTPLSEAVAILMDVGVETQQARELCDRWLQRNFSGDDLVAQAHVHGDYWKVRCALEDAGVEANAQVTVIDALMLSGVIGSDQ